MPVYLLPDSLFAGVHSRTHTHVTRGNFMPCTGSTGSPHSLSPRLERRKEGENLGHVLSFLLGSERTVKSVMRQSCFVCRVSGGGSAVRLWFRSPDFLFRDSSSRREAVSRRRTCRSLLSFCVKQLSQVSASRSQSPSHSPQKLVSSFHCFCSNFYSEKESLVTPVTPNLQTQKSLRGLEDPLSSGRECQSVTVLVFGMCRLAHTDRQSDRRAKGGKRGESTRLGHRQKEGAKSDD